jgi:diaminopimelate decarboxylase
MFTSKVPPFTLSQVEEIASNIQGGTPFHIYDQDGMVETTRRMNRAFSWVPQGYRNHFAVKALPNPHVLALLHAAGMGADCSSLAELKLCEAVGIPGGSIVFTSNNTPAHEYREAHRLGALINLDDVGHLDYLHNALGGRLPDHLSFRFNPGAALEV